MLRQTQEPVPKPEQQLVVMLQERDADEPDDDEPHQQPPEEPYSHEVTKIWLNLQIEQMREVLLYVWNNTDNLPIDLMYALQNLEGERQLVESRIEEEADLAHDSLALDDIMMKMNALNRAINKAVIETRGVIVDA